MQQIIVVILTIGHIFLLLLFQFMFIPNLYLGANKWVYFCSSKTSFIYTYQFIRYVSSLGMFELMGNSAHVYNIAYVSQELEFGSYN